MTLFIALAALAACAATPEHQSAASTASAGVEPFLPSEVRAVFQRSCQTCHGPDGKGITGVAPGIPRASNRSAEDWIKYFSETPGASTNEIPGLHPGARLPSTIWMNPDEIKAVATFLANQRN